MDNQNPQGKQQINIKITDEVLQGKYSNNMQVMHTKEEFVIDFMNIFPPNGIVNSRIIVSPGHLKRMTNALQDNLKKYEGKFGEIKMAEGLDNTIGFQER
jgi:hypothetical protein